MTKRLLPSPRTAETYFERIKGHRFPVQCKLTHYNHMSTGMYTVETCLFDDDEAALETVRQVLDWDDLELMVEGDYRPPGQYSFNRYTLVVSREGVPVHGFFGG